MRASRLVVAVALLVTAAGAHSQPTDGHFKSRFTRFLDALQSDPSAPPAFAVILVHRDRVVFERVSGRRNLDTGEPLTLDSPIYTASVTKSYVGLLAAQLDAAGLLPLTASLRDVWPDLTLSVGLDPGRVTAQSFLSHVSGLEAPAIQWRYSDTGEYKTSDVPALLPRFATRANRAYDYGNFGPVIYSAMAETRTGRSWRDLLQDHVAKPLRLTRTSARLEDFPHRDVAHCNTRSRGAWRPLPHKPTALLEAGGGVYASPRDAGTYLRAFTSDGRSAKGAIPAAVLRRTYQRASVQDRQFFGFRRTGYGLGWDLSEYDGHQVVSRSGGSAGCRTFIAFLPEQGFGVVAFSLSDVAANGFNTAIIQQAMDYWTNDPEADARAEQRLASYAKAAKEVMAQADALPSLPEDRRKGASPDFVGWYRGEGFGRVAVSLHPNGLEASAGVLKLLLEPAGSDLFKAWNPSTLAEPWELRFRRDARGRVDAFTVEGATFEKEEEARR